MTAGSSARQRWNARHGAAPDTAAEPPSTWLAAHRDVLQTLPPGRALDVACGRGRNALFVAAHGLHVDAVDVSDVAIAAVRDRAARLDGDVRAVRADLEHESLPAEPYALVVNVDYLQRSLFCALQDALVPGGVLVFETFTGEHARMNPAYTLRRGELLEAFAALDVLDHHEGDGRAAIVARRR